MVSIPLARITAVVAAMFILAACGGRPFGAVATVEQERELAAESLPPLIQSKGGIYTDSSLRAYVQELTDKLAATVDLAEGYEPLRVQILDTEAPSAYAAAGGAIFVTRGLLGMVTTEAELAGVIAHEIGHVLERHVAVGIAERERRVKDIVSDKRISLSQTGSLGGRRSIILAELEKRLPASTAFSRAQELEADQLALQMLTATGYPTSGFKDLLVRVEKLQSDRIGALGVSSVRMDEFRRRSGYPKINERVAALGTLRSGSPDPETQARLMKAIDGMIFDNRYDGGVLQNGVYRNGQYGLGFDVDEEVIAEHGKDLHLFTTDEMVILRFDKPKDRTLDDMMEISEFGRLTFRNQKRVDINGLPAVTADVSSKRKKSRSSADLTILDIDGVFATFIGLSSDKAKTPSREFYKGIIESVRSVPKSSDPGVRRFRTKMVEAGDTLASLAAETAFDGDREAALRLWNGLGPGEEVQVGQWIKLVK